jgi:hypothetical protein
MHSYKSTATAHQFHNANTMISTVRLITRLQQNGKKKKEERVQHEETNTGKELSRKTFPPKKHNSMHGQVKSMQSTSMYAEFIALCASSTAVSKPKVLSISKISLSIVFGTPTTATLIRRLRH